MAQETNEPALVGTWSVVEIAGAAAADGASPTITFAADGTITGTTGVNRFNGRYDVVSGELRTSALATTRMAGPTHLMDQEARFVSALSTPATIRIDERVTVIGAGIAELRIARAESDPLTDEPDEPNQGACTDE